MFTTFCFFFVASLCIFFCFSIFFSHFRIVWIIYVLITYIQCFPILSEESSHSSHFYTSPRKSENLFYLTFKHPLFSNLEVVLRALFFGSGISSIGTGRDMVDSTALCFLKKWRSQLLFVVKSRRQCEHFNGFWQV